MVIRNNFGVCMADTDMGRMLAKMLVKNQGVMTEEEVEEDKLGRTFSVDNETKVWYDRSEV